MGLLKALGKLQPKKICDGGGCERKHEAVKVEKSRISRELQMLYLKEVI